MSPTEYENPDFEKKYPWMPRIKHHYVHVESFLPKRGTGRTYRLVVTLMPVAAGQRGAVRLPDNQFAYAEIQDDTVAAAILAARMVGDAARPAVADMIDNYLAGEPTWQNQ